MDRHTLKSRCFNRNGFHKHRNLLATGHTLRLKDVSKTALSRSSLRRISTAEDGGAAKEVFEPPLSCMPSHLPLTHPSASPSRPLRPTKGGGMAGAASLRLRPLLTQRHLSASWALKPLWDRDVVSHHICHMKGLKMPHWASFGTRRSAGRGHFER